MSTRQHISRKAFLESSFTPPANPLKTRGFGKGIQARSAQLPKANPLQTRPFGSPISASAQQEETESASEQLEIESRLGYNGLDVPVNAPATPPPPVQRKLASGGLENQQKQQTVPGVEAISEEVEEILEGEELSSKEASQNQELPPTEGEGEGVPSRVQSESGSGKQQPQMPSLQAQLEKASKFGYNGLNVPVNAPGTPSPSVQRKLTLDGGENQASSDLLIQCKRPNPIPVDANMASAGQAIEIGGEVFGHFDWKKQVDWAELNKWLIKASNTESIITQTINPAVDADQKAVETMRSNYQQQLQNAFEKERTKIEEIIKNDPDIRTSVEEIRTTGATIKTLFTHKSSALDEIEAATNAVVAATTNQQLRDAEKSKDKAQTNLDEVQKLKENALKSLMEIPALIQSASNLGQEVATGGPQKVAISKAKALGETLIMEAYKSWAEKEVANKYDVTLKNLQFKIRNIQSQIQKLQDKKAAATAKDAALRANAAAKKVSAFDAEIQNKMEHIRQTRKTLSISIEKKYKDISVLKLQHEASAALQPLLQNYQQSLQKLKNHLILLVPWRGYYDQLNIISWQEAGMGYLVNKGDFPEFPRRRTPTEEARLQRIQAEILQFTSWLNKFGQYVESEQIWVDSEIEKVVSGGYLDFIQEIDAKLVAML